MSTVQRDYSLRGLRLRVTEVGEGPPILFIHGFLVDHREWMPVATRLSSRFRCILPDLPGCGESEKPHGSAYPYSREAFTETLLELISELRLEHLDVCGHSLGGSIALNLAAERTSLVQRLVVADSACYPFSVPLKGRLPLIPLVGPFLFKRVYGRSIFRSYFRNEVWSGHPGIDVPAVDGYYRTFSASDARDAALAILTNTVEMESLVSKIPRITAPTLIVWGADDRIFPIGLAHRLVREIPNARLETFERCGHAPNEEMPDRTAQAIAEHLTQGAGLP